MKPIGFADGAWKERVWGFSSVSLQDGVAVNLTWITLGEVRWAEDKDQEHGVFLKFISLF